MRNVAIELQINFILMMKQVLVNIPSYIEDTNYRYQMPKLQLKIEGKGNGIRTNIVNLLDISKALRCPVQYPLKYMGYELGTQTSQNNDNYIVNGAFQEETMRKTLDRFIERYILCQKCKYPEMHIILKGKVFVGQCDSCSHVSDLDNQHRLAGYIMKNPPNNVGQLKKENPDNLIPEQILQAEMVVKEPKAKKLTAQELELESEKLQDLLSRMQELYKQLSSGGALEEVSELQICSEIKKFNLEKKLLDRVSFLLFQSMFSEIPVNDLERNQELLTKLLLEVDTEHYNCHMILNIEYLMKRYNIDDKFFTTILKGFYEYSYIDEKYLLKWFEDTQEWNSEKASDFLYNEQLDNHYRTLAAPFINWMKQQMELGQEEG